MPLKSTKKLLYNIFPAKKLALFVFLAVLVLGFSFVVSVAAPNISPPAPGTKYADLPQDTQTAIQSLSSSLIGARRELSTLDTVPTSPSQYGVLLKAIGYSTSEVDNAGKKYVSDFQPANNSDQQMIDQWKAGTNANISVSNLAKDTATASVQMVGKALMTAVLAVVIGVLAIIAFFCKTLVYYAAMTLDLTLNPALYSFTSNSMIVQGWTMVRDVCNLFFLLVLLFIAICTILKIEKYHAKKTLLMLIIMALLINFSKPIAIFIFDGSQLLMNEFLKQMGPSTGTGQSTPTSVITQSTDIANIVYTKLPENGAEPEIVIQYLFAVVFLFMLAVAYIVTALMLLVRIIAVMMLIIVSPLAFFAAIVPDFSKMSSQWWSSLFEYSYYGPAAAFFLLLATKLSNVLPDVKQATATGGTQTLAITVGNIMHNLTVLVFLYASIIMAKKFGGGAGAAVVGNANKFMKWGAGMTKGGGMWGSGARGVAWGAKTTGVSGAVSQRLQQSKLGRLLTKSGREEALEEREAAIAEKIGVKGAKARQTRKRAEKLKKEGYSESALREMNARGDAAAGLRLAEDGDMNEDDYAKLAVQFKGKDDPVKKLIDGKLKEKRLDVLINYRINSEAKDAAGNISTDTANDIAREEIGKLNPSKWKDQDMQKMLGFNEKGEETQSDSATLARRNMAKEIYNKLDEKGRAKTTDDMSGSKYAAFKAAVITPPRPATPPPDVPWS